MTHRKHPPPRFGYCRAVHRAWAEPEVMNWILTLERSGISPLPPFPAFIVWQKVRKREVGKWEKSQAGAGGDWGLGVCIGAICK